jgi:DUF4097 and DUF4098 domain-containing protein YvlB
MSTDSQEKQEQTFQVSDPAQLVVKNVRGSVKVAAGEPGVIQVTAVKHLDSGDSSKTELELSQQADGTVSAISRFPQGSFDWLSGEKPCKVDFVIQAPPQCTSKIDTVSSDVSVRGLQDSMNCHTVSGDISLVDLAGEMDIHSVSGDVDLVNITGPLTIHTVSGDIEGKQLSGNAHLDSVSGDVTLEKSNLPLVEGKSISGDFKLETSLGDGPYHFHTVSGEVELKVPTDTRCSLELNSLSGRISTSLPETSSHREHGRQSVEVNGGGVEISLKSVSGGISLES